MLERLRARGRPWQHAVGKLMHDVERAMIDNWAQVERAAEDAAAGRGRPVQRLAPPGSVTRRG